MKTSTLGVFLAIGLCSPALAGSPDPALMAPIHNWVNATNKGDIAAAAAATTSDLVIIDEPPPHVWRGADANQAWMKSVDADNQTHGLTEGVLSLSEPRLTAVDAQVAYVVAHAVFAFKEKGVAKREQGDMVFVEQKTPEGWKVSAWSWAGSKPQAAPAAPAAAAPAKPEAGKPAAAGH